MKDKLTCFPKQNLIMQNKSRASSEIKTIPDELVIKLEMQSSQLMSLFEEQLKKILWTEKISLKVIPRMIECASSEKLIIALTENLEETRRQITDLAKVFNLIDKKPTTKKCNAMAGLISNATEMMENCEKGPKCDAGIISAAQKIEHYEIATYGTLRQFAETLSLDEAAEILEEIMNEEKAADKNLTSVATGAVNKEAATVVV